MATGIARLGGCMALAFLGALPEAFAAGVVEIAFDLQGRFVHSATIAPGKFVEVCGKLARGSRVAWSFEAQASVDFNVHYHVGDNVEYPEKRSAVSQLSGVLRAPVDQDYCWMWKSGAKSPVPITVELRSQ